MQMKIQGRKKKKHGLDLQWCHLQGDWRDLKQKKTNTKNDLHYIKIEVQVVNYAHLFYNIFHLPDYCFNPS